MTHSSSTNAPFSTSNASSTNQSHNVVSYQNDPPATKESLFSHVTIITWVISMILTAVVGYFSSLIAVKSDIADNSTRISIICEKLNNTLEKINDAESDLKKLESIDKDLAILNLKVTHLEKENIHEKEL